MKARSLALSQLHGSGRLPCPLMLVVFRIAEGKAFSVVLVVLHAGSTECQHHFHSVSSTLKVVPFLT